MRRLAVLVAVLLATSCTQEVDTDYGTSSAGGLNGFTYIERHWREALDLEHLYRWGDMAEDCQTIICLEGATTPSLLDMDEATETSLEQWLRRGDRQLVLVLRDGVFSNWLIERWIAELQLRREGAGEAEAKLIGERIADYRQALIERERPLPPGAVNRVLGTPLRGIPTLEPERMDGLASGEPPAGMRLSSVVDGRRVRPLISFDGLTWAGEVRVYGTSRVVLVSNAIPLFNAALVDPRARAVVAALTADIAAHRHGRAARVVDLRPLPPHPPPGIIATLFLTPPFAVISWHVLVLLVIYAWFRASRWLGRTEDDPDDHLHDFGAHLDAVGRRLRGTATHRQALAAIADTLSTDPPPPSDDPLDDARRLIQGQRAATTKPPTRTTP